MTVGLIRGELRLIAGRRGVRWALPGLAILLLASGLATWREQAGTRIAVARFASAERARWLEQSAKNPHRAAHFGSWVSRSPSPLSALDPGIDPFVGHIIRVEAHHPGDPLFRTALDAGPFRRAGTGTMTDLITLLAPLAAVLLGFASIAADRERGTLRLAVGAGGEIAALAGARFVAAWLLLATALAVPVAIVGTLAAPDLATAAAVACLMIAVVLYGGVFLAVATAVSLRARTSRGALACLLALWALGVVIAPRLVTAVVEHVRPTPSETAMRERIERVNAAYNGLAVAAMRLRQMEASLVRSGRAGQVEVGGMLLLQRDHHDNAVYDAALAALSRQTRAQDGLLTAAGLLTPALAFQQFADALTGSGSEAQLAFLDAAERYRRTMSDLMNVDLMRHPASKDRPHIVGADLFRDLPPFVPPTRTWRDVAGAGGAAAGLLAAWLAAALIALRLAAWSARP